MVLDYVAFQRSRLNDRGGFCMLSPLNRHSQVSWEKPKDDRAGARRPFFVENAILLFFMTANLHNGQKFWLTTQLVNRKKRFEELIDPKHWTRIDNLGFFPKGSDSPLKEQMQPNDRIGFQIIYLKESLCMIVALATIKEVQEPARDTLQVAWDHNLTAARVDWAAGLGPFLDTHLIELTDPAWISKVFNGARLPAGKSGFQYVVPQHAGDAEGSKSLTPSLYIRPERAIQNEQLHQKIQLALVRVLRAEYGFENVHKEHPAGYGAQAIDIVVRKNELEFVYYEIKTYSSALATIREALGQVLEYHLYPDRVNAGELIIISQVDIGTDESCKKYMSHLREQTKLPLFYQSFDLVTDQLSEKW